MRRVRNSGPEIGLGDRARSCGGPDWSIIEENGGGVVEIGMISGREHAGCCTFTGTCESTESSVIVLVDASEGMLGTLAGIRVGLDCAELSSATSSELVSSSDADAKSSCDLASASSAVEKRSESPDKLCRTVEAIVLREVIVARESRRFGTNASTFSTDADLCCTSVIRKSVVGGTSPRSYETSA